MFLLHFRSENRQPEGLGSSQLISPRPSVSNSSLQSNLPPAGSGLSTAPLLYFSTFSIAKRSLASLSSRCRTLSNSGRKPTTKNHFKKLSGQLEFLGQLKQKSLRHFDLQVVHQVGQTTILGQLENRFNSLSPLRDV
jgi:hypothetical protein